MLGLVLICVIIIFHNSGSDIGRKSDRDITSEKDPTLLPGRDGNIPLVQVDPRQTLSRYKKWAQYPPNSRPLYKGQVNRLKPYNVERPAVGVIQTPAENCAKNSSSTECEKPAVMSNIVCKMTPERSINVGKKDFTVALYCYDSSVKERKNLVLKLNKAKIYRKLFRKTYTALPPAAFGDEGNNGDLTAKDDVYTFLVRPSLRDWGVMFLEVDFIVNNSHHVQRVYWFGTPHIVAKFKSGVRDWNKGGHLVISVPVEVFKAGYYKFEANLQQKGGGKQFIATSSFKRKLDIGNQIIELQFFGKIIRDKNISGPYIVRNIRGRRNNSTVTPDMLKKSLEEGIRIPITRQTEPLYEYLEPANEHETSSYSVSEFSNNEWKSEEKERRMKYLEGLIGGD